VIKPGYPVRIKTSNKEYDGKVGRVVSNFCAGISTILIANMVFTVEDSQLEPVSVNQEVCSWSDCVWQPKGLGCAD